MSSTAYIGNELEIFQHATHWKNYYCKHIRPYLTGNVLEVGGGLGSTAQALCDGNQEHWTSLEPDLQLARRMKKRLKADPLPCPTSIVAGSVASLRRDKSFDAIVYIDVLEHIEDDQGELEEAAQRLAPGGKLIVLSPAHQYLFSEFDAKIGHFRRYSAESLADVGPGGLETVRIFYLDSVGMLASLANRLLLRSGEPTLSQIRVWDTLMVPASRWMDRILFHRVGKSVVGVWRSPQTAAD